LPAGGSVCPDCRPPGSASPAPQTIELLAGLLAGDWALADASELRHRREGSGLVAAFLQWHLERGLRSLRLVERA
jgi:DNA repair protein RecO (recombination protein O)